MMLRKKSKMFVDSADQTPHYSLRKLSVGVASVLLSTTLWMGANGSVAHADTINDTTVAGKVEDKLDPSETHKDQTQAQTAESTSQAYVASAEKQDGEAQAAVADVNQAENKQAQEGDSANAEAQTTTANDAQADVAKQEPAAQSQQTAPQAQVSAPASAEEQASTAEQTAGQASAAATEGQTNGSANAGAAIDATTKAKKDSANPEANSSDAATEGAKNESTTLDVSQAFKTSTAATVTKKMVMSSLADSISENKTKLAKANADTTAVPGFSVTDPEYPSEMYRDPNPEHYSFLWVGQTGNGYQTVISTNRNGNGQIHVFELDRRNTVLNSFDLDKNQNRTSKWTGVTYFNDEYAGLVSGGLQKWALKYEVSGGKSDHPYNSLSFIVPRLNTQVTSYQDEDGNDIIDNNGEKIESVVQRGLDGQKYTTTDTKVIDGYYAIAPSNAQGTMSPYGKIGSKYEKNGHNGYIAEFTQINNAGDMSVQMYREDRQGNRTPVNLPIIIKPGDIDIYSGVGNIYLRSIYVPQTTDIRYVYKKLGNTVLVDEDNNPFKGNTPTQYPNDPNDPNKAGKVVIPQYEGYTPKINGVPVGPDGFIPTDPGEDTIVVYTANPATALVRFIDNTESRTLAVLESKGKTGEIIDFDKANAQLNSYLDRGYKLFANEIPTTETKFDTSDDTDGPSQVFVVRLDHGTVTVTPDNPVDPGDKINPNDPDSPTYTPDQVTVTEDHSLIVHYVGAPKNPADNLQHSHWTREVTIDKVTGKTISSTDWVTTDSYVKVETPEIAGYTPDKSVVDKPTVRTNQEVTVTYKADAQKAKVAYIDDKTGKTLKTDSLTGVTNAKSGYTTADSIKTYQALGYKLVSDDTKGAEIVFDNEDGKDQAYAVHFIHDTITVDPENPGKPGEPINPGKGSAVYPDGTDKAGLTDTVDRTISYKMSDGSKAPASVKDSLTFTASKEIDKVTGEVLSTEWSKNQDFKDVASPYVTGYTPRVKTVSNKNVAHDAQNIDVVVIYDADAQKAKVAYIDDKTGKTLKTDSLTGVTNAKSGYTTADSIKTYQALGYKLVSDDTKGAEIVFDNEDGKDQAYAVHLAHRTSVVTPNDPKNPVNGNDMTDDLTKKVHQTIKYVELLGKQAAKSNVQTLTFGRSATVDLVDGTVLSYTDWDGPKSTKAVKSPKVKGFVPDKKIVPAQSYKATDADKVITVAYKAVKKAVPAQTPKAPAKKPAIPVKAPKAVKTAEPAKTISIKESAQAQDQLPQTGEDNSKAAFGLGLASILGGIGILGAFKRKKKEN
ncbi:mucin-binding protein [Lactobacillus delbrueckii]|uniref:mucin-binding protein n=3 Tax=Lactobacillus delbrueckii TaxID=1584 RepID=UPI00110902C3|nr:YSIRK-type signal peptide-containing protein [Lactobacillus delbrueckii]MCD5543740.1 YSIRK-type signal peptide-containing protein [Lactobacillus delbrueckii subsp. lactis]TLQ28164.1 YSIRK-type signal peptide-containing protein [Lactobacillus delbrueckii subsp. lactis]